MDALTFILSSALCFVLAYLFYEIGKYLKLNWFLAKFAKIEFLQITFVLAFGALLFLGYLPLAEINESQKNEIWAGKQAQEKERSNFLADIDKKNETIASLEAEKRFASRPPEETPQKEEDQNKVVLAGQDTNQAPGDIDRANSDLEDPNLQNTESQESEISPQQAEKMASQLAEMQREVDKLLSKTSLVPGIAEASGDLAKN
ncbi:MAG: hypothetical protein WC113_04650 [Candidatus Paceibacterota bacterium]|jgi:hypothetical protein